LVQDRGGAEFQTAGNLWVVEDLKRGTNPAEKGGRPKDIFVMGSNVSDVLNPETAAKSSKNLQSLPGKSTLDRRAH